MHKYIVCFAALFLPALALAVPGVLYTNLGPGQTYGTGFQYVQVAGGTPGTGVFYIGTQFTVTTTGTLTQILVPVANSQGLENFALYTNVAGTPGAGFGTPLETWSNMTVPTPSGSIPLPSIPLLTLTSAVHSTLTAGSTYWLWENSAQTGVLLCVPNGTTCPSSDLSPTLGTFWANAFTGTGGYWGGPFASTPVHPRLPRRQWSWMVRWHPPRPQLRPRGRCFSC